MYSIKQRTNAYWRLTRLNQPIGIWLLLWPTLWALWLSSNSGPTYGIFFIFITGVILMRSAGCVINDIVDMKYDGLVQRTKNRPLVAGELSRFEAFLVFGFLIFLSACLVLNLNTLTIKLSFLAVLLASTYPFTKRFLALPQAYLGIAFGFGIPMAYAANNNYVPFEAIIVFIGNVLWVIAYDTEYAMVDREDDKLIGIKTSALLFQTKDVLMVIIFHCLFLLCMIWVGLLKQFGFVFFSFLIAASLLVSYQYFLIRDRDRQKCFRAFKHNTWVGGAVFFGIFFENIF